MPSTAAALKTALACNGTFATWTDTPLANEAKPINCVTWYEAYAFCIWDSGRLPTEAEWNFAAAGGNEGRPYPWSTSASSLSISSTNANFNAPTIVSVGSKPQGAGKWLQDDLAGNVYEWLVDRFADPYAINPCIDCAERNGTERVLRGGSFASDQTGVRSAFRGQGLNPNLRAYTVGMRCAL
jgi:formylglycine-generating enzyme required for sulfatase activity